ncbi:hypothetical protein BD410DRAFT_689902, partial [Rickenella mellea]
DGSGFGNGIGAAAILMREGQEPKSLQLHLGTGSKQVVYGGEAVGLLLGAELLRQETDPFASVCFCTDNQAAILSAGNYRPGSGRFILEWFRDTLDRAKTKNGNFACQLMWTPGHCGIEGNEMADDLAKQAALGHSSNRRRLPRYLRHPLPASKAAVKQ